MAPDLVQGSHDIQKVFSSIVIALVLSSISVMLVAARK